MDYSLVECPKHGAYMAHLGACPVCKIAFPTPAVDNSKIEIEDVPPKKSRKKTQKQEKGMQIIQPTTKNSGKYALLVDGNVILESNLLETVEYCRNQRQKRSENKSAY